ncbi:MAG: dihydrolipoamide acetyltransferase family protein [Oligoflexus sp.]
MSATDVVMPLMGEGVNEATVTSWLIKEGDFIEKDAPILEVSTDKVDTEIPSPASGYLSKVLVQAGDTVQVDQILAQITSDGTAAETGTNSEATSSSTAREASTTAVKSSSEQRAGANAAAQDFVADESFDPSTVRSSPLVRKIAKDLGIDLRQVEGSGMNGRITKRDILAFQDGQSQKPALQSTTPTQLAPAPRPERTPVDASLDWQVPLNTTVDANGQELLDGVTVDRQPMNRMRQLIAKHMVESVRTSPHVTTVFEIDMHRVVAMRERYKQQFEKQEGFKLTYTPFLIHAAAQAIKQHPIVNTSLDGADILFKKDINIGCAVALDGGLIVPVIKKAGEKNLLGVARALNDLVTRARSKKLKPDEVQGGTFSITNPGGFGSLTSNPIINQPQVAILGVGTIVKRPVVIDDMIGIRPQMLASLTFDHRVIDGEGGSRYLATFKEILENFSEVPV